MATHIVRNPPRQWGNVLASNVSNVLSQLADAKVQQMASKHNSRILEDLGIDPVSARFIDTLPAKDRGSAVGQYLNQMKQQQEQQTSYADQVSANQQRFMPQQQQQQFEPAQQQQTSLSNIFSQPNSAVSPQVLESVLRSPQRQQQQRQIAAQEEQAIQEQAQERRAEQAPIKGALAAEQPAVARRTPRSLLGTALTAKQVQAEEVAARKEEIALRKEEFEREKVARAETRKYLETLKDQEKAAKESELRLKRMETLIEKGKLPNAGLWTFLTSIEDLGPIATGGAGALIGSAVPGVGTAIGAGVGGILGALSGPLAGAAKSLIKSGSPDVEEFEKLSADFVKNAKQYFGSRLTDADLRVFMQTLPTLMQTDAGKKKVIENLSSLNELAQIESKTARSIIRDNGGIPPIDIEQQVKDKIADRADRIAKRFIGQ